MKIRILLSLAAVILFSGCTAPIADAVKIESKDNYTLTVLGDIHYDGEQYHISAPKYPNAKRERIRNISQWKGKSQEVLAAAAKQSSKESAFIIQLGDITQGDCDNAELQGAAFKDVFAILKKYFPDKKILAITGNHDVRGYGDSAEAADRYFVPLLKKELGKDINMDGTNYAVRCGKDIYIFYDFSKESSGEFVKETLRKNADARHTFFLTHLPMFPCSMGNPGWIVPHFKELIPLLAARNAVILCAHTHYWGEFIYKNQYGTLTQFIVTSMGSSRKPGAKYAKRHNSYTHWKNSIRPYYLTAPDLQWSRDNLKFFKNEDFQLYQTYFGIPSGFVNLEVTEDKVVAHVFTDDTDKPYKSVTLKGN